MRNVENRMRHIARLALLLSASLAGCAAPIYLHSPSLEKATAKASTSLPDAATALKPFDDQLAALNAFAAREDMAVAQYWTTVRDAHFLRLISMSERDRRATLRARIDERLIDLIGANAVAPALMGRRQLAIDERARADRDAEVHRQRYRQAELDGEERDLSCDAVRTALAASDPMKLPRVENLRSIFRQIGNACASRDRYDRLVSQADQRLDALGGLIGRARADLRQAEQRTEYTPTARIAGLQEEIRRAAAFAESESASARLSAFGQLLRTELGQMSEAARLVALDQASDTLDSLLKGELCSSSAVTAEAKTEAGCDAATPTSSAGRARAAWGTMRALAQLSDANAPNRRSIQWLNAAKAIVAAEKAEAQLQLDQAAAETSAGRQRLTALLREMDQLAAARQALLVPQPGCHGGGSGGDRGSDSRCAFAAYVDAWNDGRIPGEVLRYRPIQIQRSFAVRRSRSVAQRQYVLASSGAGSLRDYAAGGIRAPEVAQAIFDLTVIGLIPGE